MRRVMLFVVGCWLMLGWLVRPALAEEKDCTVHTVMMKDGLTVR